MKISATALDINNHSYLAYEISIYVHDKSGKIKKYKRVERTPPVGKAPFFNYSEEIECIFEKNNDQETFAIGFPLK